MFSFTSNPMCAIMAIILWGDAFPYEDCDLLIFKRSEVGHMIWKLGILISAVCVVVSLVWIHRVRQGGEAAREALAALRSIKVEDRVDEPEGFQRDLMQAKDKVARALSLLPDKDLDRELQSAFMAFMKADEVFDEPYVVVRGCGRWPLLPCSNHTIKEYNLTVEYASGGTTYVRLDDAIRKVTASADSHLAVVSALLE